MSIVIIRQIQITITELRTKKPRRLLTDKHTSDLAKWRIVIMPCHRRRRHRNEIDNILVAVMKAEHIPFITAPNKRACRDRFGRTPNRLRDVQVAIVSECLVVLRHAAAKSVIRHADRRAVGLAPPQYRTVLAIVLDRPLACRRHDIRLVAVKVERRQFGDAAAHNIRVLVQLVRDIGAIRSELARPLAIANVVIPICELLARDGVRCENQFASRIVFVSFVVLRDAPTRRVVFITIRRIDVIRDERDEITM